MINGLPGEEPEDMLETARLIGGLRPGGVKIHALQILKDTPMADWWRRGEVNALTKEAYTDIVCRQLEWLPPETVIERLTGDGRKELLLAPDCAAAKSPCWRGSTEDCGKGIAGRANGFAWTLQLE